MKREVREAQPRFIATRISQKGATWRFRTKNVGALVDAVEFICPVLTGLKSKVHLATDDEVQFDSGTTPSSESPLIFVIEYTDNYMQRRGLEYDVVENFQLRPTRETQIVAALLAEANVPGVSAEEDRTA